MSPATNIDQLFYRTMDRQPSNTVSIAFADLPASGKCGPLRIEYQWLNPERIDAPLAIFLHEGLGSLAMWKEWPQDLCDSLGFRGLVYSRPGYGRSSPRPADERWSPDFMHRQADTVLPALLDALGLDVGERARMWLIGHSDGASIALLYAATFPAALAGVVAIAPHVMVERLSIDNIAKARLAYANSNLRERLSRYHDDVDSAFFGWNDVWLDPAFRSWDITDVLPSIQCRLLAIQGYDDEYGTMAQIDTIKQRVPHAQLSKLPACGHSPHRDALAALNSAIAGFMARIA